MDLWIRSQDREAILKVKNIFYSTNSKNEHLIRCFIVDNLENGIVVLGEYKTKERALEVLDEIQDILNPTGLRGSLIGVNQINIYVYQMPKE